ncbi:MAG: ABC transporter permease [Verrucomicrobia bacterium]|nr:ABC transporter permease [Verrucomicrobiota bacterium]
MTTENQRSPLSEPESRGYWASAWMRLRQNRVAMLSAVIVVLMGALVTLSPLLAPYDINAQDLELGASPPSTSHWMGTDELGRDQLTRLLYGGRISMLVGVCATLVSLIIGVTYGSVSGYLGGRMDALMMRLVDVLYAIPFTVFVIVLMVAFGTDLVLMFFAIGAVEWLTMARIIRGQVLSIRQQPFVQAAVALGYSRRRIIFRHVMPNVMGPIVVFTTLTVPQVMLLESLSFLGLGVQPPQSSWGLLIRDGARLMESFPWLLIAPGLALSMTLFALNALGDGLRDALDPRFTASRGTK